MKRVNKIYLLLLLSLCWVIPAWGGYWQQYVEYDMQVRLDTESKSLHANTAFVYVNHSPDGLDQILMHVFPNAYNEGTIAQDVWAAYGSPLDVSKGLTGITVARVGTDTLSYDFHIRDDTILEIQLPAALDPGDTLNFYMEWALKLHPYIDRSGWRGDQFDFAQWYPKFVVYDENGWHDDPFGDWGEFYGEVGTYKVTFDLPQSHIVAATGVVIQGDPGWSAVQVDTSRDWETWFSEFHTERQTYRETLTDSIRRKVTFHAENVHDFAWLSSPDFVYEHGRWEDIDIHVLYPPHVAKTWTKEVVNHGVSAVRWLSERFGYYAWPQMTITKALIGGGMEYPMLIMDETDSESLTIHEIGHSWFYGMLGNDELDDAWLDEGFTTFQTRWYKLVHYPANGYDITRDNITRFESEHLPRQMYAEADFQDILDYMLSPANEPIATRSFDFSDYGSYRDNVYTKASLMLHMLMNHLGEERFLAGMQLYFDRWALKHVTETRYIKAMEDASGETLDWFFDQWLHTTKHVDYKLGKVNTEKLGVNHYRTNVHMENVGSFFVPLPITLYAADGDSVTTRLEEFRHRTRSVVEVETPFKPDRVVLDAQNLYFDTDRRDNDSQRQVAYRYNFKGWSEYPNDRNLFLWKPQFGYSDDNGLGLGIRIDRVYRIPGDFVALELDYNTESGVIDVSTSFRKVQRGAPMQITWSGSVRQWRETTYADVAYEMNWAKRYWNNPLHYLTVMADVSESQLGVAGLANALTYKRIGVQYELQNDLWGGKHGMSCKIVSAPDDMNYRQRGFSQFSIMNSWVKRLPRITLNNRTNFLGNSQDTPELLKTRLATRDLRAIYLDRSASSLSNIDRLQGLGDAYYLAGGGRMRGYADSLNISANYIWSNNLEVTFPGRIIQGQGLGIIGFFDMGQYSQSGDQWEWLADYGLGLEFRPVWKRNSWLSTILRPIKLKVEIPLARYVDNEFTSKGSGNIWLFTLSN